MEDPFDGHEGTHHRAVDRRQGDDAKVQVVRQGRREPRAADGEGGVAGSEDARHQIARGLGGDQPILEEAADVLEGPHRARLGDAIVA